LDPLDPLNPLDPFGGIGRFGEAEGDIRSDSSILDSILTYDAPACSPYDRIIVVETLAHFTVHLLETIFFLGLVGSAVVVAISFVEDLHELVGKD
jgi:hypothetical protein